MMKQLRFIQRNYTLRWWRIPISQNLSLIHICLDPKERVRFRNLIEKLGKDSIVLLSTHIVSDVEHIADTVFIMKEGQLIYEGKWDDSKGDLEKFYLQQFGEENEDE